MIKVKVIERRLPWGWETLLVVNGVVGRAEEMLCLEERQPHPLLTKEQSEAIFLAWLKNLPGPRVKTLVPPTTPELDEYLTFTDAIHLTAKSVSFAGS